MDDLYEFFEFQRVGGLDKQLSDSQKISSNKYFMRARKEANRDVKADNCFICKKPCTSFCKSHSIPTFILTNIAEQGKLFRANIINDSSVPLAEVGVKQAGTFRNICRDCDSTVFQEYENDIAIENSLNNIFLSEIALKNYLNEMYKKSVSVQMFNKMSSFSPMAGSQVYPSALDALEAEQCANYALRSINGKAKGYYLFFNTVLNYRVPIAFQNRINLVADLCGNMVNNVYNFDNDYTQKSLHMCVFPIMEKWYGEEVLNDMTEKGYVVDHMNNNHMDCRICNLEFYKRNRNVAKGHYYDKETHQQYDIALNIFKDFTTGNYQITIGFNVTVAMSDSNLINAIKLLYNCNYSLVILDAERIITEYNDEHKISLSSLNFCDKRIEYAPKIELTDDEKKQLVVEREGVYYLVLGTDRLYLDSIHYDEGWMPEA